MQNLLMNIFIAAVFSPPQMENEPNGPQLVTVLINCGTSQYCLQYYSTIKKEWLTDKHNINEAQMHNAKDCGVGEDFWESLGLQGYQTSQS